MYTMTETELTDPALVKLFGRLASVLGRSAEEGQQKLSFDEPGLLLAVVAWHDGQPVGCGLLRREDPQRAELKRMYAAQPGVGSAILQYLEGKARQQGFRSLLATARIMNAKALNFYLHKGFKKCPSYGKYRYSSQTISMEKQLSDHGS
jgi:GNAT superfamily N-acetyltransferase